MKDVLLEYDGDINTFLEEEQKRQPRFRRNEAVFGLSLGDYFSSRS